MLALKPALKRPVVGSTIALATWMVALPTCARADVGELSLRPHTELRQGPLRHPDPSGQSVASDGDGLRYGGGLGLGLGVAFPWTLTLGYTWDTTAQLRRRPVDPRASQDLDRWTQDRHSLLAGVTWTPSDEWTPLISLEGGLTATHLRDIHAERGDQLAERRDAILEWAPVARASVGIEYKFLDFWSVAVQGFGEHADGLGYGLRLWLGSYRYL